jgi:hypothetical protein
MWRLQSSSTRAHRDHWTGSVKSQALSQRWRGPWHEEGKHVRPETTFSKHYRLHTHGLYFGILGVCRLHPSSTGCTLNTNCSAWILATYRWTCRVAEDEIVTMMSTWLQASDAAQSATCCSTCGRWFTIDLVETTLRLFTFSYACTPLEDRLPCTWKNASAFYTAECLRRMRVQELRSPLTSSEGTGYCIRPTSRTRL